MAEQVYAFLLANLPEDLQDRLPRIGPDASTSAFFDRLS
jgi:hypothetical protein